MADLHPDDVAANVVRMVEGEITPVDAVTLVGYLGTGEREGVVFLWDTWFSRRLELTGDQILHRMHRERDGRSVIWVKRDARIAKCEVAPAIAFAGEFAVSEGQPDDGRARREPEECQPGPFMPKKEPPY